MNLNFDNMQEQLISFDTAKLAKEKGFDIQCHWYFTHKRKFPTSEDTYYPSQTSKPQNWNDDSNLKFYERFSAPSQSLLQKWLREEHDVLVYVDPKSHHFFEAHIITSNNEIIGDRGDNWEDVLEDGLCLALKEI